MALDMLQRYSQSRRPHGSGHSMILPGTIPETPISPEWSRWLEQRHSNRRLLTAL